MKKNYFIIAGVLLLLIIGWGFYKYNKPHAGITDQKIDYTLTAADLFNSFQKDESAANKKYLGKVIEVKGMISVIQAGSGNTNIQIDASPMGGVNCSFSNADEQMLKTLKKGDTLTVKGRCTGFLMDVNLVDCALAD